MTVATIASLVDIPYGANGKKMPIFWRKGDQGGLSLDGQHTTSNFLSAAIS